STPPLQRRWLPRSACLRPESEPFGAASSYCCSCSISTDSLSSTSVTKDCATECCWPGCDTARIGGDRQTFGADRGRRYPPQRIAAAEAEINGTRINSLQRAHEFVLGLQGPLMAANPRNPRSTPARPTYGHIERDIAVQSSLSAPSH